MVGSSKYTLAATRIGSYEILRPFARGGMAELFLARAIGPEGFEKVVVLKRVISHFAEQPRIVRLFLDEAKLVATFDHPHIAHVYDMGMVDGSYFFTMERVDGVDVRKLLKRCVRNRTKLPIAMAVMIARSIASALHYAHERRGSDGALLDVVHRDVSPSNIVVSYDGVPKLIDFGIAKAATSSIKTQTGWLKGKIPYMSPEQAKGEPLDRRTDVFALGVVLWEMLTASRLYKCENDMATIQRIINHPVPSPKVARPDCPDALAAIVLRALSRDVGARYQTAHELEVALEELALELRLKQSTTALGELVRTMFAEEHKAEAELAAATITVTTAINLDDTSSTPSGAVLDDHDDDEDDLPAATWPTREDAPTNVLVRAVEPRPDDVDDTTAPPPATSTISVTPDLVTGEARVPRRALHWIAGSVAAGALVAIAAWAAMRPGPTQAPAIAPAVDTERAMEAPEAPPPRAAAVEPAAPPPEPTPAEQAPPAQHAEPTPPAKAPAGVARDHTRTPHKPRAATKPASPAKPAARATPAPKPAPVPAAPARPAKPKFDPNAVFPPSS